MTTNICLVELFISQPDAEPRVVCMHLNPVLNTTVNLLDDPHTTDYELTDDTDAVPTYIQMDFESESYYIAWVIARAAQLKESHQ